MFYFGNASTLMEKNKIQGYTCSQEHRKCSPRGQSTKDPAAGPDRS